MAVMSVCALTSVERPGVSFATCDRASDVLAMTLRSERKENILMVDEESGDQVVEMEGLRFMPACWYLHVRHNQNKIKKTTSVTEGSSAHDKLDSILPSSELELRFSKLQNQHLVRKGGGRHAGEGQHRAAVANDVSDAAAAAVAA